jgi:hypothetical protein
VSERDELVFRDVGDAERLRDAAPAWWRERRGRRRIRDYFRDDDDELDDELEDGGRRGD